MSLLWALPLVLLAVLLLAVLFLVARRLHEARERGARLGSRLAALLASHSAGLSVWNAHGRLVACNSRFREAYPGVPIKLGLELEDLMRFTVTRGLIQVPDDETDSWVHRHLARFREASQQVFRTADGRWLEVRSVPTDRGEVLLLYTDVTDARDAELALGERSRQLESQSAELALLRQAVDIAATAGSFESVVQQVVDHVCDWSGWPIGHAYRITRDDREQLEPMRPWRSADGEGCAVLRAAVERERPRKGDELVGRALQSERIVWIANLESDPTFSSERRAVMPGIRGACAVPVKSRGQVVAVLEFLSREQLAPASSATRLLRGIADAVGLAYDRLA